MDLSATLVEIAALPVEQRLDLVQAIWDTIAEEELPSGLTAAQKEQLSRRMAELDANPGIALTWAEIKERVRAKP